MYIQIKLAEYYRILKQELEQKIQAEYPGLSVDNAMFAFVLLIVAFVASVIWYFYPTTSAHQIFNYSFELLKSNKEVYFYYIMENRIFIWL